MNDQQLLFDFLMEDEQLKDRFIAFHRANPEVYSKLRQLALQLRGSGHKHYGINGLIEVLRWHTALKTTDPVYKINNNYAPYYARMLMRNESALIGFFRTRMSRAD